MKLYNEGHIADFVLIDEPNVVFETKLFNALTAAGGDGHTFAFGNTEEGTGNLRKKNLGCKQRGRPTDPPFSKESGKGYVAAHRGLYADAKEKGSRVLLGLYEVSGAASPEFDAFMRDTARALKEGAVTRDATRYGRSRRSAKSYYLHWKQRHARAATLGNARNMLNAVSALKARATRASVGLAA